MYAHHHGYLHWDAELDPSNETWFRAFSAHGYEVASFVFDTNYLFKELPEANVRGTSESLDGALEWIRANREHTFLSVRAQLGDAHALRHRPRRPQELARRQGGGDRGHPVRFGIGARVDARGLPDRGRAPVRGARRVVSRGARRPRIAREHRLRVPLRPRRVVGRALPGQGRRAGRLPHARRSPPRRDRRGTADSLRTRARAGRRRLAGAFRRPHADAPRARGSAGARDRRRVAPSRRRRPTGDDRRHRHGRAHEARGPDAAVEADPRRRQRRRGGIPARRRPARARPPAPTPRPSSASSSSASSRAPNATS